jgi:hypothetical protein
MNRRHFPAIKHNISQYLKFLTLAGLRSRPQAIILFGLGILMLLICKFSAFYGERFTYKFKITETAENFRYFVRYFKIFEKNHNK